MALNFWATFVRKFVHKKFQKSPDLVMLATTYSRHDDYTCLG